MELFFLQKRHLDLYEDYGDSDDDDDEDEDEYEDEEDLTYRYGTFGKRAVRQLFEAGYIEET